MKNIELFNCFDGNSGKIFSNICSLHQYMSYPDIPTCCRLLLHDIPLHVPQISVQDRLNCFHVHRFVLHNVLQLQKKKTLIIGQEQLYPL